MKHENLLLKSALALAIVDLVLIVAILLQVNNLVKDILDVQNKQLEIGVMKEKLKKVEEIKVPEVKAGEKENNGRDFSITDSPEKIGWKIYSNQKYGYQMEFPNDWIVANASLYDLRLMKGNSIFWFSLPPLGFDYDISKAKISEMSLGANIFAKKIEVNSSVIIQFDRNRTQLELNKNEGLIRFEYDKNNKEENIKIFDQIIAPFKFIK